MESRIYYDEQEEPIVLSKPLWDIILKQKAPLTIMGLYSFYYYTAKWQKTNIPKATNSYVAKAVGWSEIKVMQYKKILIELGLIENVQRKNESGQVIGHYVRVNFIWSKHHPLLNEMKEQKTTPKENLSVVNLYPNTLSSNNINSLSNNIDSQNSFEKNTKLITTNKFDEFWHLYPRKIGSKGKALTSWNRICTRKNGERPTWEQVRRAIIQQKRSEQWQNPKFIPYPTTWLNNNQWLDEPNQLKNWSKEDKEQEDKTIHAFDRSSQNELIAMGEARSRRGFEEL